MEDAKKSRATKARFVTRRVNEVNNGIKTVAEKDDIIEKIENLKVAMNELGRIHDEYMGYFEDDPENLQKELKWYDEYDLKSNHAIKEGRRYIAGIEPWVDAKPPVLVKLKKLEIPKFNADSKSFFKWKEKFERFTWHLDNDSKYDYLFVSTTGKAHHYVANKSNYDEAMDKLQEQYGNVHTILGTLIDEIKALSVVRKGDFRSFEQLTFQVNDFNDRLNLMGLQREAENSYVLKEIESKLNQEDTQKWLESLGDRVDTRQVGDLLLWLESQTKLRRISCKSSVSYTSYSRDTSTSSYNVRNRPITVTNRANAASYTNCAICLEDPHEIRECPKFMSSPIDEKWNIVKRLRLCFQCLGDNHQRDSCVAPKCQYCA